MKYVIERNTVLFSHDELSTHARKALSQSVEKHCKVIYNQYDFALPACFILLPYELQIDPDTKKLVAPEEKDVIGEKIGRRFLEINTITARLSFWLMLKRKVSQSASFKGKLKEWLRRAKSEIPQELASEIVHELDCDERYVKVCQEFLEQDDSVSHAKAYMKNPVNTAKKQMAESVRSILKSYVHKKLYFYLVDEFNRTPMLTRKTKSLLRTRQDASAVQNTFLPFMNITVMATIAMGGLDSLACLLGISGGTPKSWSTSEINLFHKIDDLSTIRHFGLLQRVMQKQIETMKLTPSMDDIIDHMTGQTSDKYPEQQVVEDSKSVLRRLEKFYIEHDPIVRFSSFHRVSDEDGSAIWTTEDGLEKIRFGCEGISKANVRPALVSEWKLPRHIVNDTSNDSTNHFNSESSNLINSEQLRIDGLQIREHDLRVSQSSTACAASLIHESSIWKNITIPLGNTCKKFRKITGHAPYQRRNSGPLASKIILPQAEARR